MEFFLTGVVILSAVVSYGTACPTECTCSYSVLGGIGDCSNKNLEYIPNNIGTTTCTLNLHGNKIKTIEEHSFVNLNLCVLYLDNNEISVIKENAFVNQTRLQLLNLNGNKIKTIEEHFLVNLTHFTALHLENNEISVIKENAFVNLPGLQQLYLYNNNITVLDPQMTRSMPIVFEIKLNGNQIKTIEENTFVNLTNLNFLFVEKNLISVIKENAFVNLTSLQYLYLYNNNITVLDPQTTRSMPNLILLDLHGNKIQTIEENSFVTLTNLYELNLSDNEISSIKQNAFENLRKLRYFRLQNNKLTVIRERLFYDMDNLYQIDLSGNNISFIESDAFGRSADLEYLGLISNTLICNCSILPFWTWIIWRSVAVKFSAICSNGTYVADISSSALAKCSVNGQWSNWGSWTACSMICGNETQYRNRYCNNPTPANGGSDCQGLNYETVSCNNGACPVSGQWSDWNSWTECSMTCANGTQYRNRSCNNPTPANGGSDCQGLNYESVSCNNGTCPGRTCQCYNGGICTVGSDGQFLCTCVGKWKGEKCLESQCLSYDCGNDSCYVEPVNGSAKCFPQSGFCPTTTHSAYESNHAW